MVARVFVARASCAFADSIAPMLAASFASRSAVSIRASSWPACTVSPSRTVICRTSPETLAFTVAWLSGCSVPDTGSQRASGIASTCATSALVNSSVTAGAVPGAPSAPFFTARIAMVAPTAPTTMPRITRPTITPRRFSRIAILAPSRQRPRSRRPNTFVTGPGCPVRPARMLRPDWMRATGGADSKKWRSLGG